MRRALRASIASVRISPDAHVEGVTGPDRNVPTLARGRAVTPTGVLRKLGLFRSNQCADTLAAVRVLVVTNITPDEEAPWRGQFVRDQVEGLRRSGGDVELFSFPPGSRRSLPATASIRRILRRESFDLVHAHFGLAGWCAALAGARPPPPTPPR